MTRTEAEEIFISVIMNGETALIEMTMQEVNIFRVLIGRVMKDMEKKNMALWLKAKEFGIEYHEPFCVIKRKDPNKYKIYKMTDKGLVDYASKENTDEQGSA